MRKVVYLKIVEQSSLFAPPDLNYNIIFFVEATFNNQNDMILRHRAVLQPHLLNLR